MYPKYEEDFYGWTMATAQLLKEGKLSETDMEHLIEELESLGGNQYDQLVNRLSVLITHLLKWQYQPALQGRSWKLTIKEQRLKIKDVLVENPSLKSKTKEALLKAYKYACYQAERETGLLMSTFPTLCPYSLGQFLDDAFYPE